MKPVSNNARPRIKSIDDWFRRDQVTALFEHDGIRGLPGIWKSVFICFAGYSKDCRLWSCRLLVGDMIVRGFSKRTLDREFALVRTPALLLHRDHSYTAMTDLIRSLT
jgi:hypothetical protein